MYCQAFTPAAAARLGAAAAVWVLAGQQASNPTRSMNRITRVSTAAARPGLGNITLA